MPVDINRLSEGWLELESDPGLFTLLLEDFGVQGVQVEEVYDLAKPFEGPIYGFIFLFKWIEERRCRRKVCENQDLFVRDQDTVNTIFFAEQKVPNSCATHALLSVLLNCNNLNLGTTLTRLKHHSSGMSPENKGWAIGNTPELARAHNSHASPQARRRVRAEQKGGMALPAQRLSGETFHFVSFVPIHGRLYELDGLKPHPIDHGPVGEGNEWTEKFRTVIQERLGLVNGIGEPSHDIRFNLMAVVPDRRAALRDKLAHLKTNRQIVLEALQHVVNTTYPGLIKSHSPRRMKKATEAIEESKPPPTTPPPPPSTRSPEFVPPLEPLVIHNYAKNPSEETKSPHRVTFSPGGTGSESEPDYSTPLTIQTSPAPSSSSTDTSSEVGSAFNSPNTGVGLSPGSSQGSPSGIISRDIRKLVVVRMAGGGSIDKSPEKSPSITTNPTTPSKREGSEDEKMKSPKRPRGEHKYPPLQLGLQDLLALLKNLEAEIVSHEQTLRDETDKRRKYKIDAGRRTHSYDQFICTFLSILAAQGKLSELLGEKPSSSSAEVQEPRRRRGRGRPKKR